MLNHEGLTDILADESSDALHLNVGLGCRKGNYISLTRATTDLKKNIYILP